MKRFALWLVKFVYKVSGVRFVVEGVQSYAFNYRLRLRFVPFSYKLFLVCLGAVGSYSWNTAYTLYNEQSTYSITYENTQAIETVQAKTEAIETKPEAEAWKVAEFSAYTASVGETDASPLIMASGKMVYVGAIACPRTVELGSRVEVRGLGVFVCEDRMNARYTEHFDIFKLTKAEAYQFGRKALEYRIYEQ